MTKEIIARLEEQVATKYDAMEAASEAVAAAYNDGKPERELKPLKDACKNAVGDYNGTNEELWYNRLMLQHGSNALMEGIKTFYVPGAKKAKQPENKKTGRRVSKIEDDKTVPIDLLAFMDAVGVEQFHSSDWYTKVQSFACIIANAINKSLGNDPDFKYEVDAAAKEFAFAADANPASAKSGRIALQAVTDAIVFVPSETDPEKNAIEIGRKDWQWVRETMTAKGKGKVTLAVMGTTKVASLVAEVISGILCGNTISVVEV